MSDIRFDFDVAKAQEKSLEDISFRFKQMIVDKYDPCVAELGQAWQGDESNMFQNKMMLQRGKLGHTAKLIDDAKNTLHEAIVRMRIAEENVKEIAEERTYK